MESLRNLRSPLPYLKQLASAGWEGVAAARHEAQGGVFTPTLARSAWKPTAIGAAIGLLGTGVARKRPKTSTMALAGVAGSIVGLGAGMAWASRKFAWAAGRSAVRRVNAARDAHWLKLNPIDYA